MVCGANAKSMKDVAETKRRVHTFDVSKARCYLEVEVNICFVGSQASTASKFAELFPRESGLFSSSDKVGRHLPFSCSVRDAKNRFRRCQADKEFMTEIVGMYECADKIAHGASRKIIMSLRALEVCGTVPAQGLKSINRAVNRTS